MREKTNISINFIIFNFLFYYLLILNIIFYKTIKIKFKNLKRKLKIF